MIKNLLTLSPVQVSFYNCNEYDIKKNKILRVDDGRINLVLIGKILKFVLD